jgi:hypothetical protein
MVLVCYLGFHYVCQLVAKPGLKEDDAEQVFWSQSLGWGYGYQPPLYTWLVQGAFALFGVRVASVIAVRYAVLGCLYSALYACVGAVTQDKRMAFLGAGSLLLMPTFAESSLRGYSHSLLASTLMLATCLVLLILRQSGRTLWYAALGLTVGVGLLSKYNYGLFAGGLFAAALTVHSFRHRLLDRRIVIAVALAGVLVWPHARWALMHRGELTSYLASRGLLVPAADQSGALAGSVGLLLRAGLDSPALLLGVWLLCFRTGAGVGAPQADVVCCLGRFVIVTTAVLLLLPLAGPIQYQIHWLQPFVVLVPCLLFARVDLAAQGPRRTAAYGVCLGTAALVVAVLRLAAPWMPTPAADDRACRTPYARFVPEFRAAGFENGPIVAGDVVLAGNLGTVYPRSRLWCVDRPGVSDPDVSRGQACLVVWSADAGTAPPETLESLAVRAQRGAIPAATEPHFAEVPLRWAPERTHRLGFYVLPPTGEAAASGSQ